MQSFKLSHQQRSGTGHWRELGDAVRGCVRPVGRAKRVHNENIAVVSYPLGKFGVIGQLTHIETHVFTQHHISGRKIDAVEPVDTQPDLKSQKFGQVIGHWRQ